MKSMNLVDLENLVNKLNYTIKYNIEYYTNYGYTLYLELSFFSNPFISFTLKDKEYSRLLIRACNIISIINYNKYIEMVSIEN